MPFRAESTEKNDSFLKAAKNTSNTLVLKGLKQGPHQWEPNEIFLMCLPQQALSCQKLGHFHF